MYTLPDERVLPFVVNSVVSGAPPPSEPAATSIGRGTLTGFYVISYYVVWCQIGCPVVSGPVALPAHAELSPKEWCSCRNDSYFAQKVHMICVWHQQRLSTICNHVHVSSVNLTLLTSQFGSIHCLDNWNTFHVLPSRERTAGAGTEGKAAWSWWAWLLHAHNIDNIIIYSVSC